VARDLTRAENNGAECRKELEQSRRRVTVLGQLIVWKQFSGGGWDSGRGVGLRHQ